MNPQETPMEKLLKNTINKLSGRISTLEVDLALAHSQLDEEIVTNKKLQTELEELKKKEEPKNKK